MVVLEPCKKRSIFHETVPDKFATFKQIVDHCAVKLAAPELAHLTEEQRKSVNDKIALGTEFMNNLQNELNTQPKFKDPSTTLEAIDQKLKVLKAETDGVFATPVPKAPEPPKETAPAAE